MNHQRLYAEALALEQAGYFEKAKTQYQEILQFKLDDVEAWQGLSRTYYYLEQYNAALEAVEYSLKLDGTQSRSYYHLGLIWEKLGHFSEAILAYQQAIDLDIEGIEGYLKLGELWTSLGKFESAELCYRELLERQPHTAVGYLQLGNLLLGQSRVKDAIALYQKGLNFHPHHVDLLYQMGLAWMANQNLETADFYLGLAAECQHQYATAIQFYKNILPTQSATIDIYLKLGNCYQALEQWETAVHCYQDGLNLFPDSVELSLALISAWHNLGETQTALQIAEQASAQFPHQLAVKFVQHSLLPILYDSLEEVQKYRQRFTQGLTQLIQETDLETREVRQQALTAIGTQTHFYLQYQGYDDFEFQQQYGEWVHQVMKANYPQWTKPLSLPSLTSIPKIKIGYISPHLTWHTVGLVFLGWLKECNHEQFEIHCYFTGEHPDQITDLFQLYSDQFHHTSSRLNHIVEQILEEQLQILVFLDIGMCPQITQIAGLRLAPIQCAAWGHPITTGLPTIDYFISAELLEPQDAKTHYSETLIRLPHLGINYSQPRLPETLKNRSDFGFNPDTILYLSCQSLFKYLPDFDYIVVRISQQVKDAQFIFMAHWNSAITEKFKQRLKRAFAEENLDSEAYCKILPRLDKIDYLQLNRIVDIGLDSIQFTGFLTTLDSLSCHLPLVTCDGKWMRSRQSAGILQRLGVTETIAQNREDYIRIAVELGLNPEWRLTIQEKIKQNLGKLYEDKRCVQALENFYKQALVEMTRHG